MVCVVKASVSNSLQSYKNVLQKRTSCEKLNSLDDGAIALFLEPAVYAKVILCPAFKTNMSSSDRTMNCFYGFSGSLTSSTKQNAESLAQTWGY
jgi:hypothetical protein